MWWHANVKVGEEGQVLRYAHCKNPHILMYAPVFYNFASLELALLSDFYSSQIGLLFVCLFKFVRNDTAEWQTFN